MNTALATQNDNPFAAYAQAVNQRTIVGDILRFSKGDWTAGQSEDEIDEGTRFVAVMDELMIGWVRWSGGRPVEHQMIRLADGYRPAKRSELGDTNEDAWDTDNTGKPRDPWQFTNYLILKEEEGDRLYTFAPSSRGGLSAVGQVCDVYNKTMRLKPDQFPIVEIGTSSYKHDSYGKIKVPVLKVVGWTKKAEAMAALDASGSDDDNRDEDESDIPF